MKLQVCTFRLGHFVFGLEVSQVQEVLRSQEMTRVPLASQVIRGLINLRGQIVMALDLRQCLGLPEPPRDRALMNMVLRTDEGPISLLVDEIGDVVEVDDHSQEEPPETLRGTSRRLIRGAYPLPDRLLLCLDAPAILCLISARRE